MVYSSSNRLAYDSYNQDSLRYLKTQLIAGALGLIGLFIASYIPFRFFERYNKHILLLSILGLLLVFSPLGHNVSSGTGKAFSRWVRIGKFQFQPVELIKLSMVIYVAHFLSRKRDKIQSLTHGVLPSILILSIVFLLLYIQPDFGSAVLLGLVIVTLLFVGGARPSQIILLTGIACFFVYASIQHDSYKMGRILGFINSLKSPDDTNYQLSLSLGALAHGSLFGDGIGKSIHLRYLPYPHTDFIFTIIGEELGFIGGVCVIALFMLFIWRGMHIALHVADRFASLLAFGITILIGFQTIVNIGVVTGMMPTKGLTLPFISYGGSSLLVSLISIGILLNISRGIESKEVGEQENEEKKWADGGEEVKSKKWMNGGLGMRKLGKGKERKRGDRQEQEIEYRFAKFPRLPFENPYFRHWVLSFKNTQCLSPITNIFISRMRKTDAAYHNFRRWDRWPYLSGDWYRKGINLS